MKRRVINTHKGPEAIIQDDIITKLKYLDWAVRAVHGNLYCFGFPDLYAAHYTYGPRWIEVKDPNRKGDILTAAQHSFFRELSSKGIGIWILTADDDSEIKKLFQPPNWTHYLAMYNH